MMNTRKSRARRLGARLACTALVGVLGVMSIPAFAADQEPKTTGGERVVRRLTPDQYKQSIADIFGRTIKVGGRFEPDKRHDGLLAVGTSKVSVTATGLEQYDAIARAVADQVVSEKYRKNLISCKPASETEPDNACAADFLGKAGRLLFRRTLRPEELQARVQTANDATKSLKSFYDGLALSLATMLESSQFLFMQEVAVPDPKQAGEYRLNGPSKASLLSLFFWNAIPDEELLAAAEKGELDTEAGLAKQVDRLVASPRIEAGVRAFFSDMLGFNEFETLDKDAAIYPNFTPDVGPDAAEQTLRTIVDLTLANKGDYRDLFTTRKTFLTPLLASVYGVPLMTQGRMGGPTEWIPVEYPEGDARAGLLSQVSFVSLHSHPGRSSPTLRGKALREAILCQKVPPPPGNVNFTVVQDTNNAQFKTARERLTAHRTDPTCAGCHKLIDPMGLALENFDSAGAYRTIENGATIDSSGELDGIQFKDAIGLGKAVHDSPAASACVVNRLYSFALGRAPAKGETEFVKYLNKSFATEGYRIPALMRRIATSDAFYRVAAPQTGSVDQGVSKLASQGTSNQESGK